jgi:hypothetical protein
MINSGETKNSTINSTSTDKKSKLYIPPFLLTFEIFNRNIHNCLVDSGASSNVMPYFVCKKLNATPIKSETHIIQLDRTEVKVIGELKDVMIKLLPTQRFTK